MGKLIVVIDDEPDILDLVIINLKKSGFAAKGFQNAGGLFDFLEKKKPDLIILDLMLPDADGIEVCKHIRKEDKTSSIPIIMLTAKAEETDKYS